MEEQVTVMVWCTIGWFVIWTGYIAEWQDDCEMRRTWKLPYSLWSCCFNLCK